MASGFESELWKAAIVRVYGPDWWEQLEAQEVALAGDPSGSAGEEEEEEEAELLPDLGRQVESQGTRAGGRRSTVSGVGVLSPLTSRPSSSGEGAGVQARLRARLNIPFDPKVEEEQAYAARVQRMAEALSQLDEPLEEGVVETMLYRAEVTSALAKAPDPLKHLKTMFGVELVDGTDSTEHQRKLAVLVKMIEEHGGKLSAKADKLFSSAENTPEKVPGCQLL